MFDVGFISHVADNWFKLKQKIFRWRLSVVRTYRIGCKYFALHHFVFAYVDFLRSSIILFSALLSPLQQR